MSARRAAPLVVAVLGAAGLLWGIALAPAGGGPPPTDRGYPPPGVTATGVGRARILPRGLRSEPRIRRAVDRAMRKALPRGVAAARRRAATIAAGSGIALGEVWAVVQENNVPYYGSGIDVGTFGTNQFCGRVRSHRGWRRTCRVPKDAVAYMTVTVARR
ncbi:MAG TPA: hypothetical protein VF533_17550 [Solirubrobacteraceae bacterium]